jgi:hypothetical protein
MVRLGLQGACAAGDGLPVWAGDFHAGDHRERPRCGGAPGLLVKWGAHALLAQNIALALGIKAVFADVGASLLVVGSGLRLLRK